MNRPQVSIALRVCERKRVHHRGDSTSRNDNTEESNANVSGGENCSSMLFPSLMSLRIAQPVQVTRTRQTELFFCSKERESGKQIFSVRQKESVKGKTVYPPLVSDSSVHLERIGRHTFYQYQSDEGSCHICRRILRVWAPSFCLFSDRQISDHPSERKTQS